MIVLKKKKKFQAMNYLLKLFSLFCVFIVNIKANDTKMILGNLISEIQTALNAKALPEGSQTREQQYPFYGNNGISLRVYQALQSIAKNDELECISRLLCEVAAGGQPGFSGKQIFDKLSLTRLISYIKLDADSKSPLLVFGKAALLGVTNRGDSYSCIINYPKCPRDQNRLLYYLNNHRGGFFQYFDKQYYHKPDNYHYQNHYRPEYNYQKYQKQFKQNKIQFESSGGLYEKFKKKATSDVYANKYGHSTLSFPEENYNRNKPMVFPKSDDLIDPRILTKPVRVSGEENNFFFLSPYRFPKKLNDLNFFPQRDGSKRPVAAVATDRLPSRFYFPENEKSYPHDFTRYSFNFLFPN